MSDLLESIRVAQRNVAEQMVIASLEKSGLAVHEPKPARQYQDNGLPVGVSINALDVAGWLEEAIIRSGVPTLERAFNQTRTAEKLYLSQFIIEQVARKLHDYTRDEAAQGLNDVADALGLGSSVRTPACVAMKAQAVALELERTRRELGTYVSAYAESIKRETDRLTTR